MDICGNDSKYNGRIPGDAMYPYVELEIDRCDCQARCESDARCNGFSIDYFNDICFLSRCNKSIETWPVSHHFASKIDPTSNVSCVQVTTPDTLQQPTTMAPSTKNASKPTDITPISKNTSITETMQITKNATICVCVCKYANQSLETSIEKRRRELILNKAELSSSIRKRTSAPDTRKSSRVVGTVAAIILVVYGLLFFCTDLWTRLATCHSKMIHKNSSIKPYV